MVLLFQHTLSKTLREEGINAHLLRHTHTTVLAEIGVSAKAIAERLGHADATITQNLYTKHREITGRRGGKFRQNSADKCLMQTIRR